MHLPTMLIIKLKATMEPEKPAQNKKAEDKKTKLVSNVTFRSNQFKPQSNLMKVFDSKRVGIQRGQWAELEM